MPIKSKEELIKIQNKFTGSEQRNKRIIGVILGTLRQFKNDDKERSSTTQVNKITHFKLYFLKQCNNFILLKRQ
jgi:hypothetical protein